MKTSNKLELNSPVYTYKHNKMVVNQALVNDFLVNENYKKKVSLILDQDANVRELVGEEHIGNDQQEDLEVNRFLIKNICKPLLRKTFDTLQQIKTTKESARQLKICEDNAKNYIRTTLQSKSILLDDKRLRNVAKVCRGETFLFSTKEKIDYVFELEKSRKNIEDIPQIKKGERFFRPHIENGSDLTNMTNALRQFKKFIATYKSECTIRYGIYSSRLMDKKFITYREERRKNHNISKPSNIIESAKELENFEVKELLLKNLPIEEDYEEFKKKFIDSNAKNSLTEALKDYEQDGNKLEEGGLLIDLHKINF